MAKILNVAFVAVLGVAVVVDRGFDTATAIGSPDGNFYLRNTGPGQGPSLKGQAAPYGAGDDRGVARGLNDLAELEDAYSHNPGDVTIGQELAAAYRERGEPGLALAALRAMSPAAKGAPSIQHEYALIYADLGRLPAAIAAERTAAVRCAKLIQYGPAPTAPTSCSEGQLTRMELHLAVMERLHRMGVVDPSLDPDQTREVFETTARTVRVASNPDEHAPPAQR